MNLTGAEGIDSPAGVVEVDRVGVVGVLVDQFDAETAVGVAGRVRGDQAPVSVVGD
jgi:hypothetical protein